MQAREEINPGDYAAHLTRRARGLPFWFALVAHGTEAFAAAVQYGLDLTRECARMIDAAPHLELLLEPDLSVVVFRRTGWGDADYHAWSARLLDEGFALVLPTSWQGETVM